LEALGYAYTTLERKIKKTGDCGQVHHEQKREKIRTETGVREE